MKGKSYTEEEIILCTYIALYGRRDFKEEDIVPIERRSLSSIKMKVQNICAMLKEEGKSFSKECSPLSGKPRGEKGRRTNWEWVEKYEKMSKADLLSRCKKILNN